MINRRKMNRYLHVSTLLLAILVLITDYSTTDEFHLELIYLLLLLAALTYGILAELQSFPLLARRLGYIAIALLSASNFYWLFLYLFGYRFLGASIPFIWYFATLLNGVIGIQMLSRFLSSERK